MENGERIHVGCQTSYLQDAMDDFGEIEKMKRAIDAIIEIFMMKFISPIRME
ncbi:hypothetical protein [Peribacillus sp. NPDC097295]|uniref:hypothetical protein n=1 Tax=Peribacillus sp. NPDC097295 TaxID=3364402 RepID=UPI00380D0CD2